MTRTYDGERLFAQRLSNAFLQKGNVSVKSVNDYIAYCHVRNKDIFFSFDQIFKSKEFKTYKEFMTFKGLLFHEIMHLKFTKNPNYFKAKMNEPLFNQLAQSLEDGRIETLGIQDYEKLADYFNYSVNNVLLEDKEKMLQNKDNFLINAYILCYGRKLYFQNLDFLKELRE